MKRSKALSFTITRDTREQLPYMFRFARGDPERWTKFTLIKAALAVGDYAAARDGQRIETMTPAGEIAVVERKSLRDLYSTLSGRRDAFLREMQNMRRYGYACVVIEASLESIFDPNTTLPRPTKLNPRSVIATFIAVSQRFGVHVWPCPHRNGAEQFTFRLLERWYLDGTNNGGRTSGIRCGNMQGAVLSESGS